MYSGRTISAGGKAGRKDDSHMHRHINWILIPDTDTFLKLRTIVAAHCGTPGCCGAKETEETLQEVSFGTISFKMKKGSLNYVYIASNPDQKSAYCDQWPVHYTHRNSTK